MRDFVLDVEALLAPGEPKEVVELDGKVTQLPVEPNWCPARAQIVCIVVQDAAYASPPERAPVFAWADTSRVSFDVAECKTLGLMGDSQGYSAPSEYHLIEAFNAWFEREVRQLVTFNGRSFDLPCLIHRSVALGVKPSKKLISMAQEPRYKPWNHIDVRERFTFQGCFNKGTLQDFCLAYGLPDPKAGGDGSKVDKLVAARDGESLVRYCLGDVAATKTLYLRWKELVG